MKYGIVFLVFACLCLLASATIEILYPSSTYWLVSNSTAIIMWNLTDPSTDPARFSIFLTNSNIPDLKQYALLNNAISADRNISLSVPDFVTRGVVPGYQLIFTNIFDISKVYAVSEAFEIRPSGSVQSVYKPPPPPQSPNNSTNTTTGSGSDSSGNNNNNNPNSSGVVGVQICSTVLFILAVLVLVMM
ncbi:4446_t:CDS:2 [Paraglomus occultum]|uniref:4446_t:CDS:1 n=1 Tax=Paraglomus occultum TaxID=144539 RepID=A0A9N9ASZ2_9GLOM|nr:4446_t:CDS:2 [Paraglomus occultum]